MQQFSVRIMLPIDETYQREDIEKTLHSIEQQTFGKENIELISVLYSLDPELMKFLLEYPLPHHAVYEKKMTRNSMIYHESGAISRSTWKNGVEYTVKVQPGDVLYQDMLMVCAETMQQKHADGLICEAGIADDSIIQNNIFTESRALEPEDMAEYLIRGPLHRVFYFEKEVDMRGIPNCDGQIYYDPHSWNYKFSNGNGKHFYYLSDVLGATVRAEKWFDVSFAKLLTYYGTMMKYIRKYEGDANYGVNLNDRVQFSKSLAHIAMGMACVSVLREEKMTAEDFLLFAKMVDRDCEKERSYRKIRENLIDQDKNIALGELQKIINSEG